MAGSAHTHTHTWTGLSRPVHSCSPLCCIRLVSWTGRKTEPLCPPPVSMGVDFSSMQCWWHWGWGTARLLSNLMPNVSVQPRDQELSEAEAEGLSQTGTEGKDHKP